MLCGLTFKISPFSFWQVNRTQAEKLYAKAREYAALSGDELLLDLYCGTGTIGLTMARDCRSLVGVEIIPDAVRDAEENAARNGIRNARFICADAPEAAERLRKEGLSPNVVILDPPRKNGYVTCEVTPCDMFSRTAHVESVALLKRTKNYTI